jgi:hypothetical protein
MQERQGKASLSWVYAASVPIISSVCSIGISAPHEAYLTVTNIGSTCLAEKSRKVLSDGREARKQNIRKFMVTLPLTLASVSNSKFLDFLSQFADLFTRIYKDKVTILSPTAGFTK